MTDGMLVDLFLCLRAHLWHPNPASQVGMSAPKVRMGWAREEGAYCVIVLFCNQKGAFISVSLSARPCFHCSERMLVDCLCPAQHFLRQK